MKKYEIEINNEIYHVTVKELDADADMTAEETEKTPTETAAPVVSSSDASVDAPMAGTILSVNVSSGDVVKQGDVLIVLEAMKMENEIVSPVDGTVGEIYVQVNDSVESDQALLTL